MWTPLFISENMQSHGNIFFISICALVTAGRKTNTQRRKWRARKRKRIQRGKWNPAPRDQSRRHWAARQQSRQPPLWPKPRLGNWGGWRNLTTAGSQISCTLEHDPVQRHSHRNGAYRKFFINFTPLNQNGFLLEREKNNVKGAKQNIFDCITIHSLSSNSNLESSLYRVTHLKNKKKIKNSQWNCWGLCEQQVSSLAMNSGLHWGLDSDSRLLTSVFSAMSVLALTACLWLFVVLLENKSFP